MLKLFFIMYVRGLMNEVFMKNYWLDKKLSIAVIERDGDAIRFTLSNSHVWKFLGPHKGVIEWYRMYPVLLNLEGFDSNYTRELNLCREKAWEIFNVREVTGSEQV